MRKLLLAAALLASCSGAASADDTCGNMIQGFSNQLDGFAKFKQLTNSEACEYGRRTVVPAVKRMIASAESNLSHCRTAAVLMQELHATLADMNADTEKACHSSGK